ncbi:MAG: fructose-1,6-bisphosphatase [Planctomycetia bacterium]|nr:fructose-1,6-bisphosphatase [Planctomycetia bacterium]
MEKIGYTLNQHIGDGRRRFPEFTDKLSTLLVQMAFSAKILAREFGRSALVGKLGLTGGKNPTGDTQKILDVFSNEIIIEAFAKTGLVAAIVSEELDEVKFLTCQTDARYILCIDPLDGSSNTDINGGIGTIFGIYQRKSGDCPVPVEEFFRKGSDQVAAGYVMYGPGTVLVYTIGHGVHGFTLDHDLGEFLLSHENIRCPVRGVTCSANLAHFSQWPLTFKKFVESLTGRGPQQGTVLLAPICRCTGR